MLVHGKFCDYDFGYARIYLCMGMNLLEFLYGYLGHVGNFLCMVMEKFGSCVWTCKKFWLWWNFDGALIFLLWWGIGCENFFGHVCFDCGIFLDMWFLSWEFFGHLILVMGIFWSCGNFEWDKFRINLMRSCSTNLNLSWLALMEFALMRQSRMPLVWKWMHDFFFLEILKSWFFMKRWWWWSLCFFFLKMNEAWPNALSLQIDAWLFENLDI